MKRSVKVQEAETMTTTPPIVRFGRILLAAVTGAVLLLPGTTTALADEKWCKTDGGSGEPDLPNPQNIVVFVLDDTSSAAIPTFSPAVQWPVANDPPLTPPSGASEALKSHLSRLRREAQRRRPDLNYLAARIAAAPGTGNLALDAVPLDMDQAANVAADAFQYTTNTSTNVDSSKHALHGFGGLRKLVASGVGFRRFQATAGVCGPTRASIMTGRYPDQVGVSTNFQDLLENQLTFAAFLKSICPSGGAAEGSATLCYSTGLFGKWHLGNSAAKGSAQAPWTRGFDEAIFDTQNAREHWTDDPLYCAPLEDETDPASPGTNAGNHLQGFYCTNPQLETTGCTGPTMDGSKILECSYAASGGTRFRYEQDPTPCNPKADNPCSGSGGQCLRWLPYHGPVADRKVCHPDDTRNPFCCSAGGARTTLSQMRSARYTFGGNADGKRNRSGNLLFSSARGAPCADSSKPFWETGCRYDTRYYRDFVKNFIARHGARQRLEDETSSINRTRFLVYYAPHATHQKRSAPDQTLAHYEKASLSTTANVRPLFPGHPQNFWAALEEVDAAVGQILGVIEGFCEVPMAPRCAGGGPLAGCAAQSVFSPTGSTDAVPKVKTCTTNSDCGTAKCVRNLRDRTLVLFTADQGTEGSTYGEPWLRGGKGSTYEGGIRVGLTAWSGADLAVGADETTFGAGRMAEQDLGSQVDLFPTIAHAAGCRPTADDKLGFKLKLCDNKKLVPCTSVGSVCASGGTCVERTLEGRSLLPVISPSVRASYAAKNIDAVDRRRNLAYVRWNTPKDPDLAVSSRQGYFADDGGCIGDYCEGAKAAAKVCSYEGEADPVPGVDPYDTTSAIARTRRGGSCEVCATNPENPEQDPDAECKNKNCKVNGLFCVPDDVRRTNCAGAAPHLCFPTEYARCSKNNSASPNECGSNHWCMEVVTKCTTCGDAAWKLSKLDNLTDYELFDLASNPEESKRLNCLEDLAYQPQSSSLRAVRDHLHGKLSAWKEAVTANPTSNGRAEP